MRVGLILVATSIAGSIIVASSGSAMAERIGVITLSIADPPVGRAALERAIRLAATGAGHQAETGPVVVARSRVASGAVLTDRLKPFSRAEELLEEGWRNYAQVQMAVAKTRLAAARQAALEVADLAGGVALVAETSLRLGVIKFELGDPDAAADFRLAQRLAPDRPVTDDEFKPAVVTAFRAALAAPATKRPVSIKASPKTAAVAVDGAARATGAPVELEVGLHLLVVRAPGTIAAGNLAQVPATGEALLEVTLAPEPATQGLFAGDIGVATSDSIATMILESTLVFAELDSALVVTAAWDGEDKVLLGQSCAGAPMRCSAVIRVILANEAALGVAASDLIDRIGTAPRTETKASLPSSKAVVNSKRPAKVVVVVPTNPWWANRWLWIGVGAAALAAGTTAIVLSIDGESPLVISADPCEFGRC